MKAIMVMFDSLNRHLLPPYGCDWTHAPNFSRLAQRTVGFSNSYIGSMPCMPARRELHTGRYNFLHRAWGPIEPFDDSMPEILDTHGVYTHLSTDHYHYFEDGGSTYHNRYTSWDFERGQEGDPWKGHIADPEIPPVLIERRSANSNPKSLKQMWRQDWVNRGYMPTVEAQPQPRTFTNGLEFMRTNHDQNNWFLQIETFDPHEPFFTQQEYKDLYPHEYNGPHCDWPPYRRVQETPEEADHIRYEYAALLSMCDTYMGKVLDLMDELNLWEDTMLIVCTDHGFMLGEHEWWAKNTQPWYSELARTPLFIWDPRAQRQGVMVDSLAQMIDLPATLLEFFGIARPADMQGMPLREAVAIGAPARPALLFGTHGAHVNVTDGRYVYMRAPVRPDNTPLAEYTLMPARMRRLFTTDELKNAELVAPLSFTKNMPVLKVNSSTPIDAHSFGTLLFDLATDPHQENPIQDAAMEERMIRLLIDQMKANDAPPEQYVRLGLEAYRH
jgi:arylsulfatase A-like enzyme